LLQDFREKKCVLYSRFYGNTTKIEAMQSPPQLLESETGWLLIISIMDSYHDTEYHDVF